MKTLLLAESHPPTLEHLTGLLAQAGYTVRAVSDAASAMELFVVENPSAVVVAVDLPKLAGAHVGSLIRGHSQGARVPIIAIDISALADMRPCAGTWLRIVTDCAGPKKLETQLSAPSTR